MSDDDRVPPPREPRDGDDDRRRDRRRDSDDDDDDGRPSRSTEHLEIAKEDAGFILGRGGQTKMKIQRVCGAELELDEKENRVSMYGTHDQRQKAKDYIGFIMQQRTGSVHIDLEAGRDDLTVVKVPEDCVAFVMGRGGQTLRTIEQEWGSLMFFAKTTASDDGIVSHARPQPKCVHQDASCR